MTLLLLGGGKKQRPDQTLFITEKGRNFIDGPYHLTNSNARWTRNTSNIKLAFITIMTQDKINCDFWVSFGFCLEIAIWLLVL